jgi:HK97 family phage major capsid protein
VIFVLDNYDSFTYNLVQYIGEMGADVEVRRNDQVTVAEVETMRPERILISPDMPSAAGSKAICFGDFGQYEVRVIRNGATVLRKAEAAGFVEKYAALYIGFLRVDAALNAPNGAKPVVYGTLHV